MFIWCVEFVLQVVLLFKIPGPSPFSFMTPSNVWPSVDKVYLSNEIIRVGWVKTTRLRGLTITTVIHHLRPSWEPILQAAAIKLPSGPWPAPQAFFHTKGCSSGFLELANWKDVPVSSWMEKCGSNQVSMSWYMHMFKKQWSLHYGFVQRHVAVVTFESLHVPTKFDELLWKIGPKWKIQPSKKEVTLVW